MPRHDDRVSMLHMRDHAREAVEMTDHRTRDDLDSDRMLNLSLVRLVEIVGEAAKRVSAPTRAAHPDLPWAFACGMRDRLIHGYDRVDFDILWKTVREHLPPLITQLDSAICRTEPRP